MKMLDLSKFTPINCRVENGQSGEVYLICNIDICQRPYHEFIEGIMQTNRILYEAADGRRANYDQPPKEIPRVGF
jgi:hypothetical protein